MDYLIEHFRLQSMQSNHPNLKNTYFSNLKNGIYRIVGLELRESGLIKDFCIVEHLIVILSNVVVDVFQVGALWTVFCPNCLLNQSNKGIMST